MSDDDLKKFRSAVKEELNEALVPINQKLDVHTKPLNEHTEKIDAITAELHQVHLLASTTLDVVKLRKEKYDAKLDEIRSHTSTPSTHRELL